MAARPSPTPGSLDPRQRVAAPPEAGPSLLALLLCVPFLFLWVFAFAPEPQVLVTVPAVVTWLLLVEGCRRFRTFVLLLFTFGAIAIGYGYRWLTPTVMDFGGLSAPAAWATTALFGVVGTVHGIVFALVHRSMLRRGGRPHPLTTAALFVACETLPIRLFPWMAAHGAVDTPPLLQLAAWGGLPLVSFALYCLVVPFHEWLRWLADRDRRRARPQAALVTFAVGVALYAAGAARYAAIRDEDAAAERHLRVAIVQPDIGSQRKREATYNGGRVRLDTIAAYRRGSEKAAALDAELVVWPETAITDAVPLDRALQTNHYLAGRGYDFLMTLGEDRAFLVGLYEAIQTTPHRITGKRADRRHNTAALREPGGETALWEAYRKVYLIPFGETMPFGLMEDRLPQRFEMVAGETPQDLLTFHGLTFAPMLCYEGILPDYLLEYTRHERPDVLVSLANDSWFGDTWEPHQHLNFTRFRAVEQAAPLVRATNTGVSAFVSATGDVEGRLGVGVEGVLLREVPIVDREPTLYVRLGHHLPVALWVYVVLAWLASLVTPRSIRDA